MQMFICSLFILLNSVRSTVLQPGRLEVQATQRAEKMALQGRISHLPGLSELRPNIKRCRIGEIVGMVSVQDDDVYLLFTTFMNSPAHKRVIVDRDWSEMNIGYTLKNQVVYVDVLYLKCR